MDDARRREFLAATTALAGLVGLAGCYRPDSSEVVTQSPGGEDSPDGENGDSETDDSAARDGEYPGEKRRRLLVPGDH